VTPAARGWRSGAFAALDALCALVALASIAVLLAGQDEGERASKGTVLPAITAARNEHGLRVAHYDHAALLAACGREGLPDEPDLNGSELEPVQRLISATQRWLDTRSPAALGEIGQINLAMGLEEAALQCFAAASEFDAERSASWLYFAGVCCQNLGRGRAARRFLERAAGADPGYPITLARLGALALDRGDLDDAERLFSDYRAREPSASLGYMSLGQVALARGDAASAVTWLAQAVRAGPNDFRAARLYARALALAGRVDDSRRAAAIAATLPEYFGWLPFDERLRDANRLADTQANLRNDIRRTMTQGDWPRAIMLLDQLRSRQPTDARVVSNLAAALHRAGKAAEALQTAQDAVQLNPNLPEAQQTLAEIALVQQQLPLARRAAESMVALDDDSARGHELLARAAFAGADQAQGLREIARAIELDPANLGLRLVQATMLQQAGQVAQAAAVLEDILRREPGHRAAQAQLQALRQTLSTSPPRP